MTIQLETPNHKHDESIICSGTHSHSHNHHAHHHAHDINNFNLLPLHRLNFSMAVGFLCLYGDLFGL